MSDRASSFIFRHAPAAPSELRTRIGELWLADESACLDVLLPLARLDDAAHHRVRERAEQLVRAVRAERVAAGGVDAFLREYDLSSNEGMVLMCLAEALLRIPDAATADKLIEDRLRQGDWEEHLGTSGSLFVNASTWGLMLAGRILRLDSGALDDLSGYMRRLVARAGEPVVREALRHSMRMLGRQFVMGRTIEEALERARSAEHRAYRHSYDMLGEAALTAHDAQRYFDAYSRSIAAIGTAAGSAAVYDAPGISVKLSALHPRYELAQRERVVDELTPRLLALAERARDAGIGLTVDAEESERLDLSLDLFETVYRAPSLTSYAGFGLALQAYQKRAIGVVEWLTRLAESVGRRIPVRLVKGAYWDAEIKRHQERGLAGYPVFTRKASTDVSYLACARRVLAAGESIYPMFATHNAHTLATILELAGARRDFEFQRLQGMGEELYAQVVGDEHLGVACRVYAPVGTHEDLLPYLVRRLLENGANTSFVNRIVDARVPVEVIVADPVAEVEALDARPHPRIALPRALYGTRNNSSGVNLADPHALGGLAQQMQAAVRPWTAAALVGGRALPGKETALYNPADRRQLVGTVHEADAGAVADAARLGAGAQPAWDRTPADARAGILERAADLFEAHRPELMALAVREAGKTIPDAVSEVREAVDYLRYYAQRAREDFGTPRRMPGPTGESNELWLEGRGVFACISPWNFPLAIFTGQIAAALAAGNAVLAKPAEQTPLIAARAVALLQQAGVPGEILHLLPGQGAEVGARMVADPNVAGVAFTGSTETAQLIHRALAAREGSLPVLIAETGGQNAMLADSSALAEQVAIDAVTSAFNSAGQRCSALRVLFVQEDIAPRVIDLLAGFMGELRIGDPAWLETDIGPVIDVQAQGALEQHKAWIRTQGVPIREIVPPSQCIHGSFVAPLAVEIPTLDLLEREVFGPILHVVRFRASDLDAVAQSINRTGYGLTLGVHSRIESQAQAFQRRCRVGNVYINRNQIGAVVGVQPFGGRGLSGTGPKAGGPHYLPRFACERTVTVNTAAVGGNASLLSLGEQ
jgi:RHH-type transcriptional regulator, proline utilization regulon repressor / proline dehydrogenase / delta 1-pyrroline-5-carboxylate dehydrogenase